MQVDPGSRILTYLGDNYIALRMSHINKHLLGGYKSEAINV